MESVQLKIEFENSLRRVTVGRNESLAKLKATIMSFLESEGVVDFDVKYRDEENDLITIGSDLELQEFLATANSSDKTTEKKILRLIVALKDVAPNATPRADPPASAPPQPTVEPQAAQSQAADEEEEPAPEIPWINLARALAQPEVVERVQQLLQSPVITETINRAARGYVDSKGDVMIAGLMAAQQVPLLLALIAEVLDELPVLKDLQTLVVSMFQQHCNAAAAPGTAAGCPASFPFGGPRMMPPFCFPRPPHHHHGGPPHPCPPHHPHPHPPHHPPHGGHPHHGPHHHPHHPHHGGPGDQQQGPQKHFGVFCDGCGSDEQLKRASIAAGHQTRRGFIRGLRYNSQSVHDFDLCESCKGTDRFPDSAYGPFVTIQPPACQQQQRGGRGGCGGPWWARAGGNWRAQGVQPTPPQEQQTSAQTKEAKPNQPAQAEFDFMDAIRSALSRGTEAFVEASKNENNDFGDIARAIAESLKDSAKPKEDQQGEKATPQPAAPVAVKETQQPAEAKDDWVPVATPVASEQDPFVKWATQLSQLEALGFDNSETYIKFLEEEKGDLDRVVSRIVNRDLM